MILAIIQARMTSQRLPGKVLKKIAGKPMLRHVVDAARDSELVDMVTVATSSMGSDLPICEYCYDRGIAVHTGPLDDVLSRFYEVAKYYKPSYVVRLTADCPLLTGEIIDRVIRLHLAADFDYTKNAVDGYDVEMFSYDNLIKAAKLATEHEDREHVTKFFQNGTFDWVDCFIPENIVGKYSVDTWEDFEKIRGVMEGCSQNRKGYLNAH
jgi:spore coat polysaccharide biosynthesis protein SpsF